MKTKILSILKKVQLFSIVSLCVCNLSFAADELYEWSFATGDQVLSTIAISNNLLYVGSFDKKFYALDKNGTQQWTFSSEYPIKCTAVTNNSSVFFVSGNCLYCLNKLNGELQWKHQPNEAQNSVPTIQFDDWDIKDASPLLTDSIVYYANEFGFVYGINAINGNVSFSFQTSSKSAIRTKPAIANSKIFFGDDLGYIYAVNLADASLAWKVQTNNGSKPYPEFGGIFGNIVINEDQLYFGIRNSVFQVLNTIDGTTLWNYDTGGTWVSGIPLITGNTVFVGTSDSHEFLALDKTTGKLIWKIPAGYGVYNRCIELADKLIVISGDERYPINIPGSGRLIVVDKTGKIENAINLTGSIFDSPVLDNNKIYFGSCDGKIYCISLDFLINQSQSDLQLETTPIDLDTITKNNTQTINLCYLRNKGTKMDNVSFSISQSNVPENTIGIIPSEKNIVANDSVLIRAKFNFKEIVNGNYEFTFAVKSENNADFSLEREVKFTKNATTSAILLNRHETNIKVYPNPCGHSINIETHVENNVSFCFELFDVTGKKLSEHIFDHTNQGKQTFSVDLSQLSNQQLFYRIIQGKNEITCGNLLKQ